jgi:hypothetical protein
VGGVMSVFFGVQLWREWELYLTDDDQIDLKNLERERSLLWTTIWSQLFRGFTKVDPLV